MRKRLIASLLIFAMVFTLFPAPVFAAYGDRDPEHPEWGMELNDYTKDVNVPGLVVKDYQLMEQGDDGHYAPVYTLVFSLAEGYDAAAIPDFTTAGSAPWNEIGELVKYVYIKDGITAIGDNTFADMPVLETATIEDSSKLTRIGANAFANDRRLTISANAEGERVLALPNVTEIGANAFVNCTNLGGSRSGGYTRLELGSRLTSIGASAFTACGLRYIEFTTLEPGVSLEIGTSAFSSNSPVDLTLPEGLISIGDAAFSHNTLTFSDANPEHELTIPDSVVSIGKNAFFISTDTKNDSLYKLTLGKNLESIGESAFRNYMELAVIDVRTIKQNLAIGDYAFGHDPSDAYSGIIRDESGQEYLSGAKFNIIGEGLDEAEKETVANAFVNGENCYMGEVSPLKLVETLEPTCLTKGRYTYEFSVKGQTEPKTLYEEIPELEHQYEAAGLVDGSCEFDGGQLEKCYQAAVFAGQVKDGVNGEKNVSIEADGYHYKLNTDSAYGNTGHDYQPVELTNPVIGAAADATALVYACQQEGHRVAGEYEDYGNVVQADTLPEKVTFTIPSTVVSATPFTTVAELRTKIASIKVNGGSLSLAASYGDDATFTSDQELAVVFTPDPVQYRDYDNMSAAGEAGGQTLKIKVVIEKVDFDLTKTFFQNTTEVVDLDATQPGKGAFVSPDTQPAGTEKVDVYYRPSGSDDESAWTSTPPVPKQAGTWELKAVFTYDPVYYEVRNTQHIDASRYQISYDSDAPGTVTLLSTYQVVPNDMSSLSWSPRSQMSYTGEALNRIRLLNVPVGSEISYTWTKNGEPQEPVSGIIAQSSGDNKLVGVDIAAILDAGEYVLTKVTVTCDGYSNGYLENISFTVAKRQVPLPSPVQGLSYKPGVSQTGVVENNALYTLEDSCSKIDAGTYEGVVRLVDSSNNQWADPAWKDEETAKVSFEIAPVRVARPAASPAHGIGSSVPYDGTQHVVVPLPGTAADFTYEYNAAGSLIAVYHYQGVEETALTITNAVQTDAGNYQTIAVLSGNAGGKENYVWGASAGDLAGTTADYTYDGGWSIAPARVAAPGVSVGTDNEVSYTGQALDESLIAVGDMLWSGFAQELPGGASLKVDHFEYYQNGAAVSGGTPAKQGSYELRVYYRVENGKAGNYELRSGSSSGSKIEYSSCAFTIIPVSLTLQTETTPKISPYTGDYITMPAVSVNPDDLLGTDQPADVILEYSYTYPEEYPDPSLAGQTVTKNEPFTFKDVGTYSVSVTIAANGDYTAAEPVVITLMVEPVTPEITLSASDGTTIEEGQVVKELNDAAFTVSATATPDPGAGQPIAWTYLVQSQTPQQDGSAVVEVDEKTGRVTIKGAGTAIIQVKASATSNTLAKEDTTYTVTVSQGEVEIDTKDIVTQPTYNGAPVVYGEASYQAKGVEAAVIAPTGSLVYTFYNEYRDGVCSGLHDNGSGEEATKNIPIAPGVYYLEISYPGDGNYQQTSTVVPIEVKAAAIGGITAQYETIYNGTSYDLRQAVSGEEAIPNVEVRVVKSPTQPAAEDNIWQLEQETPVTVNVKNVADSSGKTGAEGEENHYWYRVSAPGYATEVGEVAVSIEAAPLTLGYQHLETARDYNGTATAKVEPQATVQGVQAGDESQISAAVTAQFNQEGTVAADEITVTYTMDFGTALAENYTVNGQSGIVSGGSVTQTVTEGVAISQRQITVYHVDAKDRPYDGTKEVSLQVAASGGLATQDETALTDNITFALAATAAGTIGGGADANASAEEKPVVVSEPAQAVQVHGDKAENYVVAQVETEPGSGQITVQIAKREVFLQFSGAQEHATITNYIPVDYKETGVTAADYAVEAQDPTETTGFVLQDGFAAGDLVATFTKQDDPDFSGTPTEAGLYDISMDWASAEVAAKFNNYTIQLPLTGVLEIMRNQNAEVSAEFVGAEDLVYNGTAQALLNNLTVFADEAVVTSGYTLYYLLSDTAPAAPEDKASYTSGQLTDQQIASGGLTQISAKDAQQHTVWYYVEAANYNDHATGSVSVTIAPAELRFTGMPEEITKSYDGKTAIAFPGVKAVTTDALLALEPIEVTATGVYSSPNVMGEKQVTVTYALDFGNAAASNYCYQDVPLTKGQSSVTETLAGKITPANVTVTVQNNATPYIFNGATPTAEQLQAVGWQVEGTIYSQADPEQPGAEKTDDLGVVLTLAQTAASDVGRYAITVRQDQLNSNYQVALKGDWDAEDAYQGQAGIFTIEPRPVTLQIGDANGIYGDQPVLTAGKDGVTLTEVASQQPGESGLIASDQGDQVYQAVPVVLHTDAAADLVVGQTYEITAVAGGGQGELYGNYAVTFLPGAYRVEKRPITVAIQNQASIYGCQMVEGINPGGTGDALAKEGSLYTVAYTGVPEKPALVNGDTLNLILTTEATSYSDVTSSGYAIEGRTENQKINDNYIITWTGETAGQHHGVYTIQKARLTLDFENSQVYPSFGSTVNNDLHFTNLDAGKALEDWEIAKLREAGEPEYTADKSEAVKIDQQTGSVTVLQANETVRITARVADAVNFQDADASYTIHVHQASGMDIQVSARDLTYNNQAQALVTVTNPHNAAITYTVQDSSGKPVEVAPVEGLPAAIQAGTYQVAWEAKAVNGNYQDEKGSLSVTIDKATLQGSFKTDPYVFVKATSASPYNSAEVNPLQLDQNPGYTYAQAQDTFAYRSDNTDVAIALNGGVRIMVTGDVGASAKITVSCREDANYYGKDFVYTLQISDEQAEIPYTVTGDTVEYDGEEHSIQINIDPSVNGAVVTYGLAQGEYNLSAPPAYRDVTYENGDPSSQEPWGYYAIYYQIQAPGYRTQTGVAQLTIQPKTIEDAMIQGVGTSYTYTGEKIIPQVTLIDGSTLLLKDKDYTVYHGGDQDNIQVGEGFVTITGSGNYRGEITKRFEILPVAANYLSALLDRYFGYFDDSLTNQATITVQHGDHAVDASEITIAGVTYTDPGTEEVAVDAIAAGYAEVNHDALQLVFYEAGVYEIQLTVAGKHTGEFTLHYTLLPQNSVDGGLLVEGPADYVAVYGDSLDGLLTVTDNAGGALQQEDYTLTYCYTSFTDESANIPVEQQVPYTPEVLDDAGLYVVTATGQGNHAGQTGSFVFLILQRNLSDSEIAPGPAFAGEPYTGVQQQPAVGLTYQGEEIEGYTTEYFNCLNAGTAQAVSTAAMDNNNFTGSRSDQFIIEPKDLSSFPVEVENEPYAYTGQPVIPSVILQDGSFQLNLGTDYQVTGTDKGPGLATATITGCGNYKGEILVHFTISSEPGPEVGRLTLTVSPDEWTWSDQISQQPVISVAFDGQELSAGDYTLQVVKDGETLLSGGNKEAAAALLAEPGTYTVTAQGTAAYEDSNAQQTVVIHRVQPELSITVTPGSLSGGGTVDITVAATNFPQDHRFETLTVLKNGQEEEPVTLTPVADGYTATFKAANENATYLFRLAFAGDSHYAAVSASGQLVTARRSSGGGGGGVSQTFTITATAGEGGTIDPAGKVQVKEGNKQTFTFTPEEGYVVEAILIDGLRAEPASSYTFENVQQDHDITVRFGIASGVVDPDITGVSGWLNTKDHFAYVQGYPGGSFLPNQNLTRAETAQMFYNLLLEQDVPITVEFADVADSAWYAEAVNALASLEIVNGTGDGVFAPERSITRAEFTAIAMRFADLATGGDNPFTDVVADSWYYDYVVGSTQYGWITGYADGTFRPEAPITRAEVTAIVNRMLGRSADTAYALEHTSSLNQFNDLPSSHWAYWQVVEASNGHRYEKQEGLEVWTGLQ